MRVEQFLRDSAASLPGQDRACRRRQAPDLRRARRPLRPSSPSGAARPRRRARRSRRRLPGQLCRGGRLDLRRAQGRRRVQPGQPDDQGRQARLHPQQLPGARRSSRSRSSPASPPTRSEAAPVGRRRPSSPTARRRRDGFAHWNEALRAAEFALLNGASGIDIDLAMLIYTSGSTGFPKGVMMTHQNVVAAATSITTYLENTADDVILNVLPLSFDYGLYQVLMAVKVGATLVLEKSFAFPQVDPQPLRRGAGHRLAAGADHGGDPPADDAISRRARSRICATSPTPPPRCRRRTSSGCRSCSRTSRSISMYGLTECKRCT